ncbi:MAG: transposase family protein [Eubacteriaceae bacterium]|nr:transposase family protein [Eubacteriaceae bacterium]
MRLVDDGKTIECPVCGQPSKLCDHDGEQRWSHLDTMQFEMIVAARLPRAQCKEHSVKTVQASWAARHSRGSCCCSKALPSSCSCTAPTSRRQFGCCI